MRLLALDLSTSTGWALFEDGKLSDQGRLTQVFVDDFNVNAHPNKSAGYPANLISAAETVAWLVEEKLAETEPDHVVLENTVKGRNRHTQRILEWIHLDVLRALGRYQMDHNAGLTYSYMDPSEWRKVLDLRLSADDKKNNKEVKAGHKRGKVGKKHLAVRLANERFGLSLKLKDDDVADAILLGLAHVSPPAP